MSPLRPRVSLLAVVVFYGLMVLLAVGLAEWQLDRLPLQVMPERVPVWQSGLAGAALAALVIVFSRASELHFDWARRMSRAMQRLLGRLRTRDVALMAVASGVGEELLFRGFFLAWLLQLGAGDGAPTGSWMAVSLLISSLVFGLAHTAPERDLRGWWVFAFVVGILFGGLTLWTGDVIAAVVAHLTINYFNLLALSGEPPEPPR